MREKISFEELISTISTKNNITKTFARGLVKEMAVVIQEGLQRDGVVNLTGFGIFKVHAVLARQGRNIQTGTPITIPAQKKVLFKPEKQLRELINKQYQHLRAQVIGSAPAGYKAPENASSQEDKNVGSAFFEDSFTNIADKKETPAAKPILEPKVEPNIEEKIEDEKVNDSAPEPKKKDINVAQEMEHEQENKDENKKSYKLPIFLSIAAILIIIFLVMQFSGDDEPATVVAENKTANEQILKEKANSTPQQAEKKAVEVVKKPPADQESNVQETHTAKNGDNLWKLAVEYYNDGYLWPLILHENKAKITNPDFIESGITITVPTIKNKNNLSESDYQKLSKGHLIAYLAYKNSKKEEAINHLFVANKYDSKYIASQISLIDAGDLQTIKDFTAR